MAELDAVFATPLGALLICLLRIVDVSCDTMRVIFAVRGRRFFAGALGFFQAMIWIIAVSGALRHLDSILHIIGYAGGYALGTFVGVTIEQAVAYGWATIRIVSRAAGVEIAEALREKGFGVTEFGGFGREGNVEIVNTAVHRAQIEHVLEIVDRHDRNAFVTVEEPKLLRGGSMVARKWLVTPSWMRWGGGRRQRV